MSPRRDGGSRRSLLLLLLPQLLLLLLVVTPARAGQSDPWLSRGDVMGFGDQLRSLAHLAQAVKRALDNNINDDNNNNTCPASSSPSSGLPIPPSPAHCAIPNGAARCACAPGCRAERGGGPNSSSDVHFLISDRYKIGIDAGRGGGICHLSLLTPQNSFQGRNLLNAYDSGRFIQQSYYGDEDGSSWNDRPWRWNPVMGGSWQNHPPRVLFCGPVETGGGGKGGGSVQLVAASHPRNWAGQQLLDDCLMTTAVRFLAEDPALVHVRQTFAYSPREEDGEGGGTTTKKKAHARRTQEMPAVFVDRRLGELCFYDGPKPWTGAPLRREKPGPQPPNSYYPNPTERFAAYVNEHNVGVGVFCPAATGALTAYRVGGDGSDRASDTSYFALTAELAIVAGETISYDCWIAAGTMPEIRAAFRRQAVRLGMAKE